MTPDWDEKVRELTDGRGVDCVVEIGGPGTIAMSLKALERRRAHQPDWRELVAIGYGARSLLLTGRGITLGSISVGSRADFEAMNRAIVLHRLPRDRPNIPFRRGKRRVPAFRGAAAIRQGRHLARLSDLGLLAAVTCC